MAFDDATKQAVWHKGQAVAGYDAAKHRKDECGAWMSWSDYGNRDTVYGWEIDHINPGGSDALSNLRPLQWENNLAKSDGRLTCVTRSDGNKNVRIGSRV